MRITSILAAITLTLGASSAYAACTTPSANGMPAGNIPILKMSAGSGSFGAAPSTDPATGGEMYFDVSLSQMIWCDGTNWLRLDGTQAFNEPALTEGGAGGDVEDRLSAVESAVDNIGVVYQVGELTITPTKQPVRYIPYAMLYHANNGNPHAKGSFIKVPFEKIRGSGTGGCDMNIDGQLTDSYSLLKSYYPNSMDGGFIWYGYDGSIHVVKSYTLNADREITTIDKIKSGSYWDGKLTNCTANRQESSSGNEFFTPKPSYYMTVSKISELEKSIQME